MLAAAEPQECVPSLSRRRNTAPPVVAQVAQLKLPRRKLEDLYEQIILVRPPPPFPSAPARPDPRSPSGAPPSPHVECRPTH